MPAVAVLQSKKEEGCVFMSAYREMQHKSEFLNKVKTASWLLVPVVALLVAALPLFSQGSQGTIQGGVYDTSGGTIAGATVTITFR